MAVPGYSVTDLIQAATACKHVYDAFFSKYDNAQNRVTELYNTVSLFHNNLLAHAEILERSGKHYPGFDDFERTITECNEFLAKHRRRLSSAGTGGGRGKLKAAFNTATWPFEDKQVERITRRLNLQIQALNSFALTVLLEKLSHGGEDPHYTPDVIEPVESQQLQLPSIAVIRDNLLAGRAPLMLEERRSSASSEESLQALLVRATISSHQIKRREIETLQRARAGDRNRHDGAATQGQSLNVARSQYQTEAREIFKEWRRIALRNGLSESHLPQFSEAQPLETAEEYCKRALQASKMAVHAQQTPMASPQPNEWDEGFPQSPTSPAAPFSHYLGSPDSPVIQPESGSIMSASPSTIFTQRTKNSTTSTTPNSIGALDPRRRQSSFVGSISLGLPAVIDCNAELTLRYHNSKYPALKIKRIEVHQLAGACDIYCTTTRDIRIVHKIPRGHGTHPFTKHTCHNKPLEVSFLENHRVVHDAKTYSGDPHYRFSSEEDCKLFQGSIRGKDLVLVYDVEKIAFKTSDHLGEATDQHVKIWRDFDGGRFAMTFFANNPSDSLKARHREFRLAQLTLPASGGRLRPGVIRLDFKPTRPMLRRSSKPDTRHGVVDKAAGPDSPPQESHRRMGSRNSRISMTSSSARKELAPDASPPTPRSPSSVLNWTPTSRVQTISTIAVEDSSAGDSGMVHPQEGDEDTSKLKYMEITFSSLTDADKFITLFDSVQYL